MKTPICDFLSEYERSGAIRLHMPGHKGTSRGSSRDITEISGADNLYSANGIIRESELYAGELFGAHTFYSTEGSSLSIRAALCLAVRYAKKIGRRPLILAGRNAHKVFISAAVLLDFEIEWIESEESSYLSSNISASKLENQLKILDELPAAVYITSPDYLGNRANISEISAVCRRYGVILIVDNAHGAYLKFLEKSEHPIDFGADIVCDSAHKTLSALTGAAYLHISKNAPSFFYENTKDAMMLFGSTSPSYLILASLDKLNEALSSGYKNALSKHLEIINGIKTRLKSHGYALCADEPMKITIYAKAYGYLGNELAEILQKNNIVSEFSDPDYLVLMPSTENSVLELNTLCDVLLNVPKREPILIKAPCIKQGKRILSPRDAVLSDSYSVSVYESCGKILSDITVACPPAIPIAISGELITDGIIEAFLYYGIKEIKAVKQ